MSHVSILISEVGPRDGLQSITAVMPIEAKKAWIAAEAAAGVREIEVGSFVPAKVLPQLADTAEVVAFARTIPGLTVAVLVPNARGAANAIAAGAHKLTLPLSVSETHSLRNLNRTHEQVFAEARQIAGMIAELPEGERPHFEGSLSTVFGCTLEGQVADATILRCAEQLMAAGCDEVGLSDTTGYADPAAVKRMIKLVRGAVGDAAVTGIHLHNSRVRPRCMSTRAPNGTTSAGPSSSPNARRFNGWPLSSRPARAVANGWIGMWRS